MGSLFRATPEALMYPLGHYVGAFYGSLTDSTCEHHVMLGNTTVKLTADELTVWQIAHGRTRDIRKTRWTRSRIVNAAAKSRVRTAERIVADLLGKGVVAETVPGSEHSIDFAEHCRFVPLMLGLGNSPTEPWMWLIGFFDRPLLKVSHRLYGMWEWAHVDNSLWAACHAYADTSKRAGQTDPDDAVPEQVLTGFVTNLHTLLAAGAGYLDLAWRDPA